MVTPEPATVDFPWIVSVDDHVIEPPDVWTARLPARYRGVGPRVERLPAGSCALDGAATSSAPAPTVRSVDYWVYEDLYQSVKRLSPRRASPRRDDADGDARYDDVRPGCYEPAARLATWTRTGPQASLCFPNFPRFCGQTFVEAADRELALLCVRAYNDWMVEEWCAVERRPARSRSASSRCGTRSSPRAEVERNAARGVRAVAFSEIPAYLGSAEHPQRRVGSVLRGVRGDRHRAVPPHRLRDEDADDVARRAARRDGDDRLRQLRELARRLAVLRQARAVPRACGSCTRRARSGGSRTCSSGPTTSGSSTRRWVVHRRRDRRTAVHLLLPPGVRLLLPRLPRRGVARLVRRRQRDVRGRLPALRLDLARQPGGRRGHHDRSGCRRRLQARAGTRSRCSTSTTFPSHPSCRPRCRPAPDVLRRRRARRVGRRRRTPAGSPPHRPASAGRAARRARAATRPGPCTPTARRAAGA